MTDKELGKALLTLDTAPPPGALDPKQLARNIIARDGRRLHWLAAIASLLWLATTAGIIWLGVYYLMYVEPRLLAYAAGKAQLETDWRDWAKAGDIAARSLLGCMIALLLAAISTVVLILLSRRATLRQINASLLEISQHVHPNKERPSIRP